MARYVPGKQGEAGKRRFNMNRQKDGGWKKWKE